MNKPGTQQTIVVADSIPDGNGGFRIIPKKPKDEIGAKDVAKILGVSRSGVSLIIQQPLAAKIIKWRWLTPRRGKRMFKTDSVIAYLEASRNPSFGEPKK